MNDEVIDEIMQEEFAHAVKANDGCSYPQNDYDTIDENPPGLGMKCSRKSSKAQYGIIGENPRQFKRFTKRSQPFPDLAGNAGGTPETAVYKVLLGNNGRFEQQVNKEPRTESSVAHGRRVR